MRAIRLAIQKQRCVPTVDCKSKVHTGFLDAYTKNTDAQVRAVEQIVKGIIGSSEAKGEDGISVPYVY